MRVTPLYLNRSFYYITKSSGRKILQVNFFFLIVFGNYYEKHCVLR